MCRVAIVRRWSATSAAVPFCGGRYVSEKNGTKAAMYPSPVHGRSETGAAENCPAGLAPSSSVDHQTKWPRASP